MSNNNTTCPVCGAGPKLQERGTSNCTSCGTRNAFAKYFISQKAYDIWDRDIQQRRAAHNARRRDRLRTQSRLIVGPESLAFHDTQEGRLTVFDRSGSIDAESHVKQYSLSNLHQVTLRADGTVSARGDNDAGQCRLPSQSGFVAALAAPRCTYLVTTDGTVQTYGSSSIREQLSRWKDITAIACGANHVAGLTKGGTVVQADSQSAGRSSQETAHWHHVIGIAAAFNYTLGLHADGTVSYAGPKQDMAQQIATWRNICAIAADTQYAVGLTKDGNVMLAGSCSPFLDGGRSSAREWKDIVCIGAGHSVIAALNARGELLTAGRFLYSDEIAAQFRKIDPAKI